MAAPFLFAQNLFELRSKPGQHLDAGPVADEEIATCSAAGWTPNAAALPANVHASAACRLAQPLGAPLLARQRHPSFGALFADRPIEKLADLGQHFYPRIAIIKLMFQLLVAEQLDRRTGFAKSAGHLDAVRTAHIHIQIAMYKQRGSFDSRCILQGRALLQMLTSRSYEILCDF